jgi:hypothetical protein
MDSASVELADVDGLSVEELKALLREQREQLVVKDAQLLTQSEQLGVKDELLRFYTVQIEALKSQLQKLRRMQFGSRSEKNKPAQSPLGTPSRGASFPRISRAKRRRSRRVNQPARTVAASSSFSVRTSARCSNSSRCASR